MAEVCTEHAIVVHQCVGIDVNERRRTRSAPGDYLTDNMRSSFFLLTDLCLGCGLSKTVDTFERLKQVGEEMFRSPLWPVHECNGEWRLTVSYCGLNEVPLSLSAAVPDMLELQCELKSRAAKWCHH